MIGGWTEFQFAERRMPTLDEINTVAPDTPVFVLHLYDRALVAVARIGGYHRVTTAAAAHITGGGCHTHGPVRAPKDGRFWEGGCDCFAF